jgi:hypothetical protein
MAIAMVAAFAATGAMASECKVQWGTGATEYFTISTVSEFPRETTCDVGGVSVPCTEWLYEIKADGGEIKNASKWYQTIGGYGFTATGIFESIVINLAGDGTNNKKIPCFGDNLGLRVIEYKSTDNGDPQKFGFTVSDNPNMGLGHSSMVFLFNQYGSINCVNNIDGVIGLPGPAAYVVPERLIRNTEKLLKFQAPDGISFIEVVLLINETDCTFTASIGGEEQEQFPLTDLIITGPDGDPMQVLEGWSSGKCDEATYEGSGSTCIVYQLGGRAIKYCF